MKALYWRSNRVSAAQLVVLSIAVVLGTLAVETQPIEERGPLHALQLQAARQCAQGYRAIHLERIRQQLPLEIEHDPAASGLIGPAVSPIVSTPGHLPSKQTSVNPNFAAAFVVLLSEAGVREGDLVAVGLTGSFPAANVALLSAIEALGAEPLTISSVAASAYGATVPSLTWLDMERVLFEQDLLAFRSRRATLGGVLDQARDHTDEGRQALREAIGRSGLPFMEPAGFAQAVSDRLALYDELAGERTVAAYVNVGGGTVSVGTTADKEVFRPGLNTRVPRGLRRPSVMRSFLERGVPVVHVTKIRTLARRFGLPDQPLETPGVGEGDVYTRGTVRAWVVLLALLLTLVALWAATRFDARLVFSRGDGTGPEAPEAMV
ncbi:MAG: poly-gamma-glutamate system protein [Myxococcota bacterium]